MKLMYEKKKTDLEVGDIIVSETGISYLIYCSASSRIKLLCLNNCSETLMQQRAFNVIHPNEIKEHIKISKIIKNKDIVITEERLMVNE